MKLLYGTTNSSKLDHMRLMVDELPIEIIGLSDLNVQIDVTEDGDSPLKNAVKKAETYYRVTHLPCFSADSGLYIDGLADDEQPGVIVRRRGDKYLDDEAFIPYYQELALSLGGEIRARFQNAICLILDEKHIYAYDGDDIADQFILTAKVHPKRIKGFPMNSISRDLKTGKYLVETEGSQNEESIRKGIKAFFKRSLNDIDSNYIGNQVFGKAYQVMYENDVHALGSVDRALVNQMILLNEKTKKFLYGDYAETKVKKGNRPALQEIVNTLKSLDEKTTVMNILKYLSRITLNYDTDVEDMLFGGTEEEILQRGTDWCTDISRVCSLMLQLAGIPSRIIISVNGNKAYHGHVFVEAYYDGHWGCVDPVYGVMMYETVPLDAYFLMKNPHKVRVCFFRDYKNMSDAFAPETQYNQMAIVNYSLTDYQLFDYTVSRLNEYTRKILNVNHNGQWFMGEDS